MHEPGGIELSLLEGMDETLLVRLHKAGIRTREQLEPRIATRQARASLSMELDLSPRRLEILHHLNYLLPEERAERFLEVERSTAESVQKMRDGIRGMRRTLMLFLVGVAAVAVLAVVFLRPGPPGPDPETAARLEALEAEVALLRPLGTAHAEGEVMRILARLGPVPGWSGRLPMDAAKLAEIRALLRDRPNPRGLAAALALRMLAEIENAPLDSLGPMDRAERAERVASEFTPVSDLEDAWDAAAVLVRSRIRSRALGLAPFEPRPPEIRAAVPWSWTSPGYLTCEELVARLEGLPVSEDAIPTWSESLVQLRHAADLGRDRLAGHPEEFARDYWIRRGEMELAVVAALLGRRHLLPYHRSDPRTFLIQRRGFLEQALERAPAEAVPSLAWLRVEYAEALSLVDWAAANPSQCVPLRDRSWVRALDRLEEGHRTELGDPSPDLEQAVSRAAQASGSGEDPFTAPRTRWEAGLRPLLITTRTAVRKATPPAPPS